jgi:hypothetical protein
MAARVLQSRASRPGKKAATRNRPLRTEPLEPRMMLTAALPATPMVQAPTIAQAIAANGNLSVSGRTAAISVLGADVAGATSLRYTWSVTTLPAAGSVSFAANGSNAAKSTTATFNEAGTYGLKVTITDAANLSVTGTTTVIVSQTLTTIRLSDGSTQAVICPTTRVAVSATSESLVAQGLDQFGNALTTQPTFTWSTATVPRGAARPGFTSSGAATTVIFGQAGTYGLTVKGTLNGVSATGSAMVVVNPVPTFMSLTTVGNWVEVQGATAQLSVSQFLDQFRNPLPTQPTLAWSVASVPAGARQPTLSLSGKTVTVTVSHAGLYGLVATMTDSMGHSATYSEYVIVDQVATSVAPFLAATVVNGASQQFSNPVALDEFGNAMVAQPFFAWSFTTVPSGAQAPTFSPSSSTTTVTFHKAGSYVLKAFATNTASNLTVSTTATVNQVATRFEQVPATTVVVNGSSQQFSDPVVLDQFGNPMATQPSYTWVATTLPSGAQAPTFSTSGTTTTAVFSKAGSYGLKAYVTGASNLTFSTTATVNQTFSGLAVSPSSTSIRTGATQQFTAQELDQFHNALATQLALTWSASAGTITTAGLYTAPGTSGLVTVSAKSGTLSGSASLTIGGSNSLGLVDQTLANLVQSLDADGSISRLDMIQILRSVAANGTLGATDLADLRTIVGADATKLNMPSYVRVLANDVVNSNPANAHYQGQTLGNLAANSTATQLNDLVNKWFLGTDLPDPGNSLLVYESAAGSLYDPGSNTPVIADEFQGALGDCYFISTLGSIAKSNPTAIENMFINNGDGTYTVRFYTGTYGASGNSDGSVNDGFTNGIGTADYVTVNTMLPTYNGRLVFADYETSYTATQNDLWIPLAEKAYAQWNETGKEGRDGTNTYASIEGGWMAPVDAQVLGHNATDYSLTTGTEQNMIAALTANKAVTIGTICSSNSNDTLPYGLYGCHAYAVTGYNASNNTFTLYNPWGFDQPPAALTWAEVMATTDTFTVASTSGSLPISTPVKSGIVQAAAAAAGLAAATPDTPFAAITGQSPSESGLPLSALAAADSASVVSAATGGSSSSAEANATRALFDRFGMDSAAATFSEHQGDSQTSQQLAAFSVDELFGVGSGVAVGDFA